MADIYGPNHPVNPGGGYEYDRDRDQDRDRDRERETEPPGARYPLHHGHAHGRGHVGYGHGSGNGYDPSHGPPLPSSSSSTSSRYPPLIRRSASPGEPHAIPLVSRERAGSAHSGGGGGGTAYRDHSFHRTTTGSASGDGYDLRPAGTAGRASHSGLGVGLGLEQARPASAGVDSVGGGGSPGEGSKMEDGPIAVGSRKARIANVCDTCRSRKIGCPGGPGSGQPCARCIKDRRVCVYKGPPTRSSLTRARMTELEGRTRLYAQLWDTLFPTYTMTDLEAEFGYKPRTASSGSPEEKPASPPDGATTAQAMEKATAKAKRAFWDEWGEEWRGAGQDEEGRDSEWKRGKRARRRTLTDDEGGLMSKLRKVEEIPGSTMTSRRPSFTSAFGGAGGGGHFDSGPTMTNSARASGRNSVETGVLPAPAREFLDEVARGEPGAVRAEDFEWNERRKNDAVVALAGLSNSGLPFDQPGGPSSTFGGMYDPMSDLRMFDGQQEDLMNAMQAEDEDASAGGRLDGMVSLAKPQQGVSYLGLSSGAIFLSAIRRLCADPDVPFDALQDQPRKSSGFPRTAATDPHARASVSARSGSSNWNVIDAGSLGNPGLNPTAAFGQHGNLWSTSTTQSHESGETFPLPPQAEIWPLIDSYFSYFHAFTPLVHEPTIKAQVLGAVPIPNRAGSAVLFNMIFAMGAFDAGQFEGADDGTKYYERARLALTEDLLEEGTLPLVQGVAIMANYLQRNHRPNAGYLCLGIATRMATALGLHTTPIKSAYSVLDREMRKRIWWCLVTLEAGCSVTFGRPCGLSRAAITAMPLPINCNDEHLNVSTTGTPADVPIPTVYTALIVQSRLARLTTGIHGAILQSHPTLNQLKRYDKLLVQLQTDLAPFMQTTLCNGPYHLARSVQVWRIRDFRAILYRPVLLAAAWDAKQQKNLSPAVQEAIGICRENAVLNLGDIEMYIQAQAECHTPLARGTEWYALFFAFQSCLTLLLSTLWEPGHPAAGSWRMMLSSTASWFRTLRTLNKLGVASAQVLDSIIANAARTPSTIFNQISPEDVRGLDLFNGGNAGQQLVQEQSAVPLDVWRYWLEIAGQTGPTYESNMTWDPSLPTNLQYPMQ